MSCALIHLVYHLFCQLFSQTDKPNCRLVDKSLYWHILLIGQYVSLSTDQSYYVINLSFNQPLNRFMNDICMPNLVPEYTPNGRRNADRPRKRWRDKSRVAYILLLSMTIVHSVSQIKEHNRRFR